MGRTTQMVLPRWRFRRYCSWVPQHSIPVQLILNGEWETYYATVERERWLLVLDSMARQKPHTRRES